MNPDDIRTAAAVIGLDLTPDELALMVDTVSGNADALARLRRIPLANDVPPALRFDPAAGLPLPDEEHLGDPAAGGPADSPRELPWADLPGLGALLREGQLSCVELTTTCIERLRRLDASLHHVVTVTEDRALAQARALDEEAAAGRWRGPLHGIPWGAKDLLAVRGYPTTWGAPPFQDQVIDDDATVVRRLDEAGAVLVAKLTLGELAYGDTWFGGMTRSPWDPTKGSSGSSAGSAAAVASGCVPVAIGSETLGSLVSPSTACGTTAIRPTFGRVSRHGAMALSWSMDKLGPMARSVDDAAAVLAVVAGRDPLDPVAVDRPFTAPGAVDVSGWRVGYLPAAFDEAGDDERRVLEDLRGLGAELVAVELPVGDVADLVFVLMVEAAAAFDDLTRSGTDDRLVRQTADAWPNLLRAARLVPAVEYVNANRRRTQLIRSTEEALRDVAACVHPSFGGGALVLTNLTGHPAVVAPCGMTEEGMPKTITFTGRLFGEARLVALAAAWQRATDHHRRHPPLDDA